MAMIQLTELHPGTNAIIRHLDGGHSIISRLAAMGFTPGGSLSVVRSSENGPLLVCLRGSRVALGQGEASHIFVSLAEEMTSPVAEKGCGCEITIALTGQPNVGKSSVFNLLTGLNQHVGNWTGKTVENKEGKYHYSDVNFRVVDLPGTYSLTASSEEERIARDYLLHGGLELAVVVVNAASLERSLYLVAEMLLLPVPLVIALNMTDVAEQEGVKVDPRVLEAALGIPVVPMVAARGTGLKVLQETILQFYDHAIPYQPRVPSILPAHQAILDDLMGRIQPYIPAGYPPTWLAIKLLEGDEEITALMKTAIPAKEWEGVEALLYQHEDAILDIAGARYEWAARIMRAAVEEPKVTRASLTANLDRLLTHPFWGTLGLLLILGAVFWLTYSIGSPIQVALSKGINTLAQALRSSWPFQPGWFLEFLAVGLLGGIGMILTFLPILVIFFASLGFLEDTGYMSRAAFLSDRWMHKMGLHGKSFMPILLGFGCNVPAVLGTRIIESHRSRLLTTMLIPLIPCTARIAVITVLAAAFFGQYAFWISWGLVGLSLAIMIVVGLLLHHFFFENEHVPFIMELPLYHVPNMRTIGIYTWENILGFLKKAGTTILIATMIIWALAYFPSGHIEQSYLGMVGRFLEPVGSLMGLPWPVLVALLASIIAKENAVATLAVLYGSVAVLAASLPLAAALAFMVFLVLFIPCVGTVAAIRQETKSWKWTMGNIGMQLVLSLSLAIAVFQVGRLF